MTTDVTHDPRTDWCACEPESADRCDYRLLADAVIASLDVHDGDEAEVALCITAVEHAAAELARLRNGGRTLGRIVVKQQRTFEAARIEMHQNGPKTAMEWILNSIPPPVDEGDGLGWDGVESAQHWFDRVEAADKAAEAEAATGTGH